MPAKRYPRVLHADWSHPASGGLDPSLKEYAWTVPAEIMNMIPMSVKEILHCVDMPLVVIRNLHLLDAFSGKSRLARWGELLGLRVACVDRDHSPHLDVTEDEGLACIIATLLRVYRGGLCFMGPQCSSWVWLCRSVTKRSALDPDGDLTIPTVQEGNYVNRVTALLASLCALAGIFYVIEQPSSSLFFHTKILRAVIAEANPFQRWLRLKDWGHSSKKATVLVGTASWLTHVGQELSNKAKQRGSRKNAAAKPRAPGKLKASSKGATKPKAKAKARATAKAKARVSRPKKADDVATDKLATVKVKDGKKQVTGNARALKLSQIYPVSFALEVMQRHYPTASH